MRPSLPHPTEGTCPFCAAAWLQPSTGPQATGCPTTHDATVDSGSPLWWNKGHRERALLATLPFSDFVSNKLSGSKEGHICQDLSCLMLDIYLTSVFVSKHKEWGKEEMERFRAG